MFALFATPKRRIIMWALGCWIAVREMQAILTALTLRGALTTRFSHWFFFDAYWYAGIARHGYSATQHPQPAYFPLYPLLAHILIVVHTPWQVAMLLVSNLATLAALMVVGIFVFSQTSKEMAAVIAVGALTVSPLGVFLSAMYSDSLFLALAAGAFLAVRRRVWWLAGMLLGAAVITRPFGLLLAAALLVELLCQRAYRAIPFLAVPPLISLGSFLLVMWHTYGSPLVVFSVERVYFGHAFSWPWQTVILTVQQFVGAKPGYPKFHILLDAAPLLLAVVCIILMARRWPLSYSVYVASVVLVCLVSPILYALGNYAIVSDGRYTYAAAPLLLIPVSCWLTRWPRWSTVTVLVASLVLQLILVNFELHAGWLV